MNFTKKYINFYTYIYRSLSLYTCIIIRVDTCLRVLPRVGHQPHHPVRVADRAPSQQHRGGLHHLLDYLYLCSICLGCLSNFMCVCASFGFLGGCFGVVYINTRMPKNNMYLLGVPGAADAALRLLHRQQLQRAREGVDQFVRVLFSGNIRGVSKVGLCFCIYFFLVTHSLVYIYRYIHVKCLQIKMYLHLHDAPYINNRPTRTSLLSLSIYI